MANFLVSEENWSLHRKGYRDQQRHIEKVREAVKNNLPDLISEESIILSKGRKLVKIPIRSLDEYKIRYNYDKTKHVGQGDGKSKVGDIIAREPGNPNNSGAGKEGNADASREKEWKTAPSWRRSETGAAGAPELPGYPCNWRGWPRKHNWRSDQASPALPRARE